MFFIDPLDFHFKHPTTIQVSGVTRCGKTRLVCRILEKQLIQPFATRIIWVFSKWQPDYDIIREQYPGIEYEKRWGVEIFDSLSPEQRNIMVIDDQIKIARLLTSVADPVTKGLHHKTLPVIYLVQNAYNQGNSQRTISLNSNYSVVCRNSRGTLQFRTMAYQIYPNNGKWLVNSFTDATSKPYGYLVLDQNPSTPDEQTVVTNILPKDQLTNYKNSLGKDKRHYNFLISNRQFELKRKSNKLKVVQRRITFFFVTLDFTIVRAVIRKASNAVIGAISNGALNCRQGALHISLQLKPLFRHNNHHFYYLVDHKKSIRSKRHLILQKHGALPIIAALLATILGSIGGKFISRLLLKNDLYFFQERFDRAG